MLRVLLIDNVPIRPNLEHFSSLCDRRPKRVGALSELVASLRLALDRSEGRSLSEVFTLDRF